MHGPSVPSMGSKFSVVGGVSRGTKGTKVPLSGGGGTVGYKSEYHPP
jgi:hypothetical protein